MTVAGSQRKKAGISRVAIKKDIIETHGYADEKRTMTMVSNQIRKLSDEGLLENVTVQSFHLSPQGLELARKIRASKEWKVYTGKAPDATRTTRKRSSSSASDEDSTGTRKKQTTTSKRSKDKKPGSSTTKETRSRKASGSTTTTGRGGRKASNADSTKKSPTTKKTRAPAKRNTRVFFDAVIEKEHEPMGVSREERMRLREARKIELSVERDKKSSSKRGRGGSSRMMDSEDMADSTATVIDSGAVADGVVAKAAPMKGRASGRRAAGRKC